MSGWLIRGAVTLPSVAEAVTVAVTMAVTVAMTVAGTVAVVTPAAAAPGEGISEDRRAPTTVWILEGARDHDSDTTDQGCALEEFAEEPELPAGLRADAHLIHLDCGATYVFLDFPEEIHGRRHTRWARTTVDKVSLKPPRRDPWADAPALREVYVWRPQGKGTLDAMPVDDPDWTQTYRLAHGEKVELLAEQIAVLRTSTGRTVVASGWWIEDDDPLLADGKRQQRVLRDRLVAGRANHPGDGHIRPVPPADELAAQARAWKGQPFELVLRTAALRGEVFDPQWLEPVGQVLDRDCGDRTPHFGEACGAYYLDYRAFGAWWPRHDQVLVGLLDGVETVDGRALPRLRIVVREPWSDRIEVSPAWDGE